MNILGISSGFHDSSAALIKNGEVIANCAEERFSFQKHDPNFPALAIHQILNQTKIDSEKIDYVAYHEDPVTKFSRVLSTKSALYPEGVKSFAQSMKKVFQGQLWIKVEIAKRYQISPDKVHFIPHHLSHAAYTFLASGYSSSSIFIADAVGEWSCTTLMKAQYEQSSLKIEPVMTIPYPHSLGILYSVFTAFLGFSVNDGECSTMALAAFGQPRYRDKILKVISFDQSGSYQIDSSYFDFNQISNVPFSKKFLDLFGSPRSFNQELEFGVKMTPDEVFLLDDQQKYYADIAASIQAVLEEITLKLCSHLQKTTQEKKICLAGGVALNSTLNGKIMRETSFNKVFIPPDPGDGGGAIGAALYLNSIVSTAKPVEKFKPNYGLRLNTKSIDQIFGKNSSIQLPSARTLSSRKAKNWKAQKLHCSTEKQLIEKVVESLQQQNIVGWMQGGFENGPRALGFRSLLIDPRSEKAAQLLSHSVKKRAPFRPYACSIMEEDWKLFFDLPGALPPEGLFWMSSTHKVKPEAVHHISQAIHIDGTTRPQILRSEENPIYYKLLKEWKKETGCPALLNTSFNSSGYPLVSTPVDGLLMFSRTDIDLLAINNILISKEYHS